MILRAVSEDYVADQLLDEPVETPSDLPKFEGEDVHNLRAKLVSASNLEVGDDYHKLDQTVRLLVIGRVTRVDHVVDDKSGQLTRVETFKVVDALQVPWEAVSEFLAEE